MSLTDKSIEDLWYLHTNSSPMPSFVSLRNFVRAIDADIIVAKLNAQSDEQSAEIERLKKERDEYKSAWQRAGEEYRKLRDSLLSLLGEFK